MNVTPHNEKKTKKHYYKINVADKSTGSHR